MTSKTRTSRDNRTRRRTPGPCCTRRGDRNTSRWRSWSRGRSRRTRRRTRHPAALGIRSDRTRRHTPSARIRTPSRRDARSCTRRSSWGRSGSTSRCSRGVDAREDPRKALAPRCSRLGRGKPRTLRPDPAAVRSAWRPRRRRRSCARGTPGWHAATRPRPDEQPSNPKRSRDRCSMRMWRCNRTRRNNLRRRCRSGSRRSSSPRDTPGSCRRRCRRTPPAVRRRATRAERCLAPRRRPRPEFPFLELGRRCRRVAGTRRT